MITVAVDTNAYSDAKRGIEEVVDVLRAADEIGVPSIVIGELLAGFGGGKKERKNRAELDELLRSPRVRVLSVDTGTAERHASVWRDLRRRGVPIPTNDLWIAALALQHGCPLLTQDAHFNEIPGLRVVRTVDDLPLNA